MELTRKVPPPRDRWLGGVGHTDGPEARDEAEALEGAAIEQRRHVHSRPVTRAKPLARRGELTRRGKTEWERWNGEPHRCKPTHTR